MIQQNVPTLNKHNSYCSDLDCFFFWKWMFLKNHCLLKQKRAVES